MRRAIEAPLRQLADNAGLEGALVVSEAKRRKGNEGLNIATNEWVDLVKAGVVDPTKVTRSALQNAASISGLLLTTEAVVTELPEKNKPAAGGGRQPRPGRDGLLSSVVKLAECSAGSPQGDPADLFYRGGDAASRATWAM